MKKKMKLNQLMEEMIINEDRKCFEESITGKTKEKNDSRKWLEREMKKHPIILDRKGEFIIC